MNHEKDAIKNGFERYKLACARLRISHVADKNINFDFVTKKYLALNNKYNLQLKKRETMKVSVPLKQIYIDAIKYRLDKLEEAYDFMK